MIVPRLNHGTSKRLNLYNNIIQRGFDNIEGNEYINDYINNISSNPQLRLNEEGKYTITTESPCYNSGTHDTTGFVISATDYKGNSRITFDTIDIGAIEFNPIMQQPQSKIVCMGSSVTLKVEASAASSYQWQKAGKNISGAQADTLNIESVLLSDEGDYHCIIESPYGTLISNNARVSVQLAPDFISDSAYVDICHGKDIALGFGIDGKFPRSTAWFKENGVIISR